MIPGLREAATGWTALFTPALRLINTPSGDSNFFVILLVSNFSFIKLKCDATTL